MAAGATSPPSASLLTAACTASIRAGSSPLGTELFETNDVTISAARSIGFDVVTVVLTAIYFASPAYATFRGSSIVGGEIPVKFCA